MADKYTEEIQQRISKLPERLRNYIAKLEMDVAHYRKLLTETDAGQTSVLWTDYSNEKYLPNLGVIRYTLPNGGKIEVSLKDDRVEVRGGDFNETLVILSAYSNCFYTTILKSSPQREE